MDDLEIDKFEAELLTVFERKKFLLTRYTEDGFCIQGEGLAETKIKIADFFKMHKEGKSVEEIVQIIASGNQRKMPEKPEINNIYPLIKDRYFASGYPTALKKAAEKAGVEWDQGYLPLMFKNWPEHEIYIFSGVQTGQGYRYLSNTDFGRIGMPDKQFFVAIMENLHRKIDGFMKEGKIKITKQDEGIFSLNVPDDLAVSFLLVANKYFDFLVKFCGETEFFYVFTVTTEEIILCNAKVTSDKIKELMTKIIEKQKDAANNVHHPVSIEPVLITKNGLGFQQKK
ncbi:MAG: hypothetical protein ABH842_04095 [Candidatus Micrarchaeota archaeon]